MSTITRIGGVLGLIAVLAGDMRTASAQKMYWTQGDRINRANRDGSDPETLISGLNGAQGIDLDLVGRKVYWTDTVNESIHRADLDGNLDGTGVEDVATGLAGVSGLALDLSGGRMYWTDESAHRIRRRDIAGGAITDIVTGLNVPEAIALDLPAGEVYWTDDSGAKIRRRDIAGEPIEDLVTGGTEERTAAGPTTATHVWAQHKDPEPLLPGGGW